MRLFRWLIPIGILLCCIGCTATRPDVSAPAESDAGSAVLPTGTVRLCALSVGKADCLLLTAGSFQMLIDTGESQTDRQVVAQLEAQGVRRLDLVLLTHNDKDHIGGAAYLLRTLPVDRVIQADYDTDSAAYTRYISAATAAGITPERLRAPLTLSVGGATLRLLPAAKEHYENDNDFSVFTEVTVGSRAFLLTGDAEKERLTEFLALGSPRVYDLIKLPHHGSWNGATKEFLQACAGENVLISTSLEKGVEKKLKNWLENQEKTIYYTYHGAVTALTDGTALTILQEQE